MSSAASSSSAPSEPSLVQWEPEAMKAVLAHTTIGDKKSRGNMITAPALQADGRMGVVFQIGGAGNLLLAPFGVSEPKLRDGDAAKDTNTMRYNMEVTLPKNSPEHLAAHVFEDWIVDQCVKRSMILWGKAKNSDRVLEDIRRITQNNPPEVVDANKPFDPFQYDPSIRVRIERFGKNATAFFKYQGTDDDGTPCYEPSVYTEVVPYSRVIVQANFSGMYFVGGRYGPIFTGQAVLFHPPANNNVMRINVPMRVVAPCTSRVGEGYGEAEVDKKRPRDEESHPAGAHPVKEAKTEVVDAPEYSDPEPSP